MKMENNDFTNKRIISGAPRNLVSKVEQKSKLPLSNLDRREFLSVSAFGTAGATLSFVPNLFPESDIQNWDPNKPLIVPGKELKVQPVLMYSIQERREQSSWKSWGDIRSEEGAAEEAKQIAMELEDLSARSDFPLKVLPVIKARTVEEATKIHSNDYDAVLLYPATGSGQLLQTCFADNKDTIIFVRHQSGHIYYWYEALSTAYLKTDNSEPESENSIRKKVHVDDVVVDDYDEMLWRLRALYGVKNFIGTRIVALGGAGGKRSREAPQVAKDSFKMEIVEISYDSVEKHITSSLTDKNKVSKAEKLTDNYLAIKGTALKTDRTFITNAFLLYSLFKELMQENNATAITINSCMGTIIPLSKTTACLALSLLNDEGYLAFCESDFVIIPPSVLLRHIEGKPVFMHNSTFPHNGIATCAHCTGPRRMDGVNYEPAEILTHYESEYGAAPKVSMPIGQEVTFFNPEFSTNRWLGFKGNVKSNPFYEICRSQQEVEIHGDWEKLKNEVRDSHWVMVYGDYLKEGKYAARRIGVKWEDIA